MRNLTRIITLLTALLLGAATDGYAQSTGPTIKGNVYGGGENAKVKGEGIGAAVSSTSVTINNGQVKGNVYGAGKGVTIGSTPATGTDGDGNTINPLTYDQIATVSGNTQVTITAKAKDKQGMVWGNIYGGAALAIVDGDTHVNIEGIEADGQNPGEKINVGGKLAGDVFGGGQGDVDDSNPSNIIITSANVLKNTYVNVSGGEIIWDKMLNGSKVVPWDKDNTPLFFDKTLKKYTIDHNIYAGGDIACTVGTWNNTGTQLTNDKTGTSYLTMTRGLLSGELLGSDEWKEAYTEHENPHFYAFGGGYGIYTKAHKSEVNICLPMVDSKSATGGNQQLIRPKRAPGDPGSNPTLDLDVITDQYGVAWATVLGILGGGYNGHVEETNVLVGDATYAHRVYGGGLGSYQGWVEAGKPADMAEAASAAGKVGTVGPLTGEPSATEPVARVTLAGGHIHGDVFGGGAGVASGKEEQDGEGNWSIARKDNEGNALDHTEFTDFTEIARVKGNTLVETTSYETYLTSKGTKETLLTTHPNRKANTDPDESKRAAYPLYQRAQVFGNVYGGGDVANVSGNTRVSLFGGDVFGYTFGAGLGRLATEANNYTTIGNVTGNSAATTADLVDWTSTSLPVGYIEPYKPTAWDDIYGGGRNGVTDGDASVTIAGGYVGNNIFGGGLGNVSKNGSITSADVKGNTTVTITGGEYQWRQIADVNGNKKTFPLTVPDAYAVNPEKTLFESNIIYNRMMLTPLMEHVKDFFAYSTASYTRDHSIYGGGNVACRVGTYENDDDNDDVDLLDAPTSGGLSTVDMQHGLFADTDIKWTDDEQWNLATLCRYLACENASNYQFGVFGGGYGANTKVGETQVNLHMGESTENQAKWTSYMGAIRAEYDDLKITDIQKINDYYGGDIGENGFNRYLTARMARSINVPSHTVLTAAGGGFAGYVTGNTSVHQYKRSGTLRVFGGGIGQRPADDVLASLNQAGAEAMTYGQVGGNTSVDVEYGVVVKDVYGGGAGIESLQNNSGNYVDFTNMARVIGKTDVTVHTEEVNNPTQTLVYGQVFGGGDVANVGLDTDSVDSEMKATEILDPSNSDDLRTKVTVTAGCVFGDVFAGGSGRTAQYCDDYKNLGAVYGNTQLVINQTGPNSTWLWKDAYGGGRNGIVYGNTLVDVEGGWLGSDVYGGGLGNLDTKYNPVSGLDEQVVTKASVKQSANILVEGGQYCLSQSWNEVTRNWHTMNKDGSGNSYSSQYDPIRNRFLIGHNIYGGGNVACDVVHNAWVDVNKGLLPANNSLGHKTTENLFEEDEWKNIYDKHASPYFSVFGGGYGENTTVSNTHVTVNMGETGTEPSASSLTAKPSYSIFSDRQTLLDVIGGGFQGGVTNTCYVDIDGYTFMRNAFGGAYYATVGNTDVKVTRANMDNVYGGGMMGDVKTNVKVKVGTEYNTSDDIADNDDADAVKERNRNLIINQDVYGANDVAGYVGALSNQYGDVKLTPGSEGVKIRLNGGHIHGNVYGGGNGNYLYQIDEEVAMVSVQEDVDLGGLEPVTIYKVPLRISDFPSLSAMSDQQKMTNVISYRPATMKTDIDFKGNSAADRLQVDGKIFGGGNSATITDFDGSDVGEDARVKINVGSHIRVGGVFLGSDGEALFKPDPKLNYMAYFPQVNNLQLYDAIDWTTPENQNIPIKFLPTPPEKRPEIYQNNIDLYFMPVEMAIMPEVTWGKARQNNSVNLARKSDDPLYASYTAVPETEAGLIDAEIGTFCCGGNRGNMDTPTAFHIYFPEGLTITENIIGGCNNANYTYEIPGKYDSEGNQLTLDHTGGFLHGTHSVGGSHYPQINLTLRNKFRIEKDATGMYPEKCNVFGGCYTGGTVRGDIRLEVLSNMLMSARDNEGKIIGLDSVAVRRSTDAKPSRSVCGIYGGGYGVNTWVYGDTEVRLGNASIPCYSTYSDSNAGKYNTTGASCYHIFGGGREGSIVGNTFVRVQNGRVGSSVVGASYSGYLYGNAQVIVGYRDDYYVCEESGKYHLKRVDDDPQHKFYVDVHGKPIIKQDIWLTKGDYVSKASYEELDLTDDQKVAKFSEFNDGTYPASDDEWNNINIQIDKAIYGGGYALAGGGSVGAGSYTVRKYTSKYNLNEYAQSVYGLPEGIKLHDDNGDAAGGSPYGGNTFVMIGDRSYDNTRNGDGTYGRDHITISSSQLRPIVPAVGQNLFGKYHEVTSDNGTPDNKSDDFTTIEYIRTDILWNSSMQEKFYEYTGEGGIYGDGHLSLAEGFRLSDMLGYGYNGSAPVSAKLMNCIHRFDIVRLADCCFSLLGDRDYASTAGIAVDATPYSLANVGELKMISSIDKTDTYMDPLKDKRSRNYMGLSNRVTNVGAVYSDVSFNDAFHHGNEGKYNNTKPVEHENYGDVNISGMSYLDFKKKMIETYYDCKRGKVKDTPGSAIYFQLRNDGTAKNLIGIGSGYALIVDYEFDRQKTQDILEAQNAITPSITRIPDNQGIDGTYYGPVKGVFEVNLISVREGEAGGYVYAQNIHNDTSYGSAYGNTDHLEHFLEASGNFVFPVTSQRKVIDDCFPVKYNSAHNHTAADGHYWYVTGLKYFYNATITGYTFDDQEMTFDMANSNLFTLAGSKAGQQVMLEDFHIVNRHVANDYACDFERDVNGDHTGYDLLNQVDAADANKAGKYMFSISTSKLNTYTESYEDAEHKTIQVPYLQTMHLNDLGKRQSTQLSTNVLDQNDAPISIRITDNVNNNGKLSNGKSYYETYLSDPCQAVIMLTVPAQDDNGFVVYNNDLFDQWSADGSGTPDLNKQYYILNFDGTYLGVKADDLSNYKTTETRKLLYVLKDYRELTADEKKADSPDPSVTYYISTDGGKTGTEISGDDLTTAWAGDKNNLYVVPTPVKYEYTIDLTIRYIKGPSHSGHINIKNCALPGEMIRLSHENVVIESDENSLPHNGNYWIIGPGKKVWNDPDDHEQGWHWEFVDDFMGARTRTGVDLLGNSGSQLYYNDPASRNLYYPYNPFVTDPKDNYRLGAYNTLVTEGMHHPNSAESKEYYLPAYYYMDGYVAQYCYTVQNINNVFRTDIMPVDTLCVHNYHRMVNANDMPTNTGDKKIPHDLFVPWAAQYAVTAPTIDAGTEPEHQAIQAEFAAQWLATHHRPRVYIEDVSDLRAFATYLARTNDTKMDPITIIPDGTDDVSGAVTYAEVIKPASYAGANTDFILMADLTVPNDWTPIANFNGALHGNGHVISGLGEKALFASLGDDAHIYNLGLQTGKIATTKGNATYSCCYTYANKTVYRMDGTAVGTTADGAGNTYTDDDWRYGRVAYNLNEYYLAERMDRGEHDGHDTHTHTGYVESLYAEGDYRYARYNVAPATSEYLRNDRTPLYGWGNDQTIMEQVGNNDDFHISYHDYEYDKENNILSHRVDEARALFNGDAVVEETYAGVDDYNTTNGTSLTSDEFDALPDADKIKTPAKAATVNEYRPLIDEVKLNSTETLTAKKNDYIFFGQTLNVSTVRAAAGTVGTSLPAVISASANTSAAANAAGVTHAVNDQTNRVWRAYGFYQQKLDDAFHFNRAAWALHPELTAIDFTGQHDTNYSWQLGKLASAASSIENPAGNADIFYPKMMDMPDNMLSFDVMSNRNYNADGTTNGTYANSNYGAVTQNLLVYNNNEQTAEGNPVFTYTDANNSTEQVVQYHNLVFNSSAVDPEPKYSTDYFHLVDKQDFNAPIAFNVNTRAWYERLPLAYRNVVDKGYGAGTAWEGIVLPFTATKVTAAQGVVEAEREISHFYGSDYLHHEYWLRGLKSVDVGVDDEKKAIFARPAESGSEYFTDSKQSGAEYTYPVNTYFTSLYNYNPWFDTRDDEGEDTFGNHDKAWYAEAHTFDDYVHLTADVPYIVAFPGDDFYEFSMESYYKTDSYGPVKQQQKATFEVNAADAESIATIIKVSDDNPASTSSASGYIHYGTFLHEVGKLGINATGTAFDGDDGNILPFRTYFPSSGPSPIRRYVISELGKGEQPFEPGEPDVDVNRNVFEISIDGLNVTVTSSYEDSRMLNVYLVGGQLVLHHEAKPGTTHFRLPKSGTYIIGHRKYMVR